MPTSVSFRIRNNQANVNTLIVYDARDPNNPAKVKTINNLKAGATTEPISVKTIGGGDVGRANWDWDGNETNHINVQEGQTYEMSDGAPS